MQPRHLFTSQSVVPSKYYQDKYKEAAKLKDITRKIYDGTYTEDRALEERARQTRKFLNKAIPSAVNPPAKVVTADEGVGAIGLDESPAQLEDQQTESEYGLYNVTFYPDDTADVEIGDLQLLSHVPVREGFYQFLTWTPSKPQGVFIGPKGILSFNPTDTGQKASATNMNTNKVFHQVYLNWLGDIAQGTDPASYIKTRSNRKGHSWNSTIAALASVGVDFHELRDAAHKEILYRAAQLIPSQPTVEELGEELGEEQQSVNE